MCQRKAWWGRICQCTCFHPAASIYESTACLPLKCRLGESFPSAGFVISFTALTGGAGPVSTPQRRAWRGQGYPAPCCRLPACWCGAVCCTCRVHPSLPLGSAMSLRTLQLTGGGGAVLKLQQKGEARPGAPRTLLPPNVCLLLCCAIHAGSILPCHCVQPGQCHHGRWICVHPLCMQVSGHWPAWLVTDLCCKQRLNLFAKRFEPNNMQMRMV